MSTLALPALDIPRVGATARTPRAPKFQWTLDDRAPGDWRMCVDRLHAGFFHSPLALALASPGAQPVFATLRFGSRIAGIAVGARTACRLSTRRRHAYFPSLPLFAIGMSPDVMLVQLLAALRADGVHEARFDSFDSAWQPLVCGPCSPEPERAEYVVPLLDAADDGPLTLGQQHQRHLKRGEREGWSWNEVPADEGLEALNVVSESAAARGATRGNAFSAAQWHLPSGCHAANPDWGLSVFAARQADTLLAAALVGYTAHRAFYLSGGSTLAGYAQSASVWLHWRTMQALRTRGVAAYNLGGAPSGAAAPDHPSHGLHRFKLGFSPTVYRRNGLRWNDRTVHVRTHQLVRRFVGAVQPGTHV